MTEKKARAERIWKRIGVIWFRREWLQTGRCRVCNGWNCGDEIQGRFKVLATPNKTTGYDIEWEGLGRLESYGVCEVCLKAFEAAVKAEEAQRKADNKELDQIHRDLVDIKAQMKVQRAMDMMQRKELADELALLGAQVALHWGSKKKLPSFQEWSSRFDQVMALLNSEYGGKNS